MQNTLLWYYFEFKILISFQSVFQLSCFILTVIFSLQTLVTCFYVEQASRTGRTAWYVSNLTCDIEVLELIPFIISIWLPLTK